MKKINTIKLYIKNKLFQISSSKVMAVMFVVVLFVIAGISDYKVMNFYINDEIDYNEWNASTDSKFETDYISNFWLKYNYVNLNGFVSNLIGQQKMNGVVKLDNGYLLSPMGEISQDNIIQFANQTESFNNNLKNRNIQYIYTILPYVADKYNSQMPVGVVDYGNANLDKMKSAMSERNIEILDLREKLFEEGLETYDIFYKTDHHWTTKGGFWAFNELVKYLEETNGFLANQAIKGLGNYSVTTYEKWHLGSNGQRTGIYYAGIDDFDLILPNFDTYIERYGTAEGGTIQDMMINMEPLENREYTSRYTYDNVMGGSLGNWHNPNADVDKTLVVIGDSMLKSVCPYLALSFSNVIYLDMYGVNGVNDVNSNFLDTYEPDIIVSFYYPANMGNAGGYNWGY